MSVPSEQPLTTTDTRVPLEAPGANVHPVADPPLEKSPEAMPVTISVNDNEKVDDNAFVGDDGEEPQLAPGIDRSTVTEAESTADDGPLLHDPVTDPAARRT